MRHKYYLLILCLSLSCSAVGQDVKSILAELPTQDRVMLHSIFYTMVNGDNFGYTLFGDKPVSLSGDFIKTPLGNIIRGGLVGEHFWKKWEVWKKYRHLFPIKNYILLEEASVINPVSRDIILINKKAFLVAVNENIGLFKEILGDEVSAESLLRDLERADANFSDTMKGHEGLWGVLLGYGRGNAMHYHRRNEIQNFVDKEIEFDQMRSLVSKPPQPSRGFQSLQDEYDFLIAKLQPCGQHGYSLLLIGTTCFVGDPYDPETIRLQEKYADQRGRISAIYSKGDFLEITLSKLTAQ